MSRVNEAIAAFDLLEQGQRVLVALSGGKDSLFLDFALRDLGYETVPVIIDMGYRADWGRHVLELTRDLGINASLIRAVDMSSRPKDPTRLHAIAVEGLAKLQAQALPDNPNFTPCTHCYNVKVAALDSFARENDLVTVAFGHHATDSVASLLKSAFMFMDRWDFSHVQFDRANFADRIREGQHQLSADSRPVEQLPLIQRLRKLVADGSAGTDEPPVQPLAQCGDPTRSPRLVRPLFLVFEHAIAKYWRRHPMTPEGSECGHGATLESQTPREMVHYRLLGPLSRTARGREVLCELLDVVQAGLRRNGTSVSDTRRSRALVLGPDYKGTQAKL